MNGLQKPLPVLLLLLSLLAVSITLVGIAVAQSNCTVNSSGGCSGQTITAPNESGNYNYTICFDFNGDRDTLDTGECTTTTLQVANTTNPSASVSASADKISFGTALTLTGTGRAPDEAGVTITGYTWTSDTGAVSRTEAKSAFIDSFIVDDLPIGKHKIRLAVDSSDGQTSPVAEQTIIVTPPALGNPVKIVPRIATAGTAVRAYNMPGPLSSIECRVSEDGVPSLCTSTGATVIGDPCISGRLSIPVVGFPTEIGSKKINFTIAESAAKVGTISKRPVVQAGGLSFFVTPPPKDDATSENFGLLRDSDFIPGGLNFEVSSSEPIASVDSADFTKGLFYALHRVKQCGITEVVSPVALEYSGAAKDQFVGKINLPQDCLQGETCTYLIELIGVGSAGGQLIDFDFERGSAVMFVDQLVVDFGQVAAGDSADDQLVIITNNGEDALTNLKVVESSSRLSAAIDATTLAPEETATLSISLDTLATDIPSNYTETIGVTASYGPDVESVGIVAKYEILEAGEVPSSGFLVADPAAVNFGQLKPGDSATQIVSIANYGETAVSGLQAIAPVEIDASLDTNSLAPEETALLTLVLTIPPEAPDGPQQGSMDVVDETGEASVSIGLSFVVGAETIACETVEPPVCEEGNVIDSDTDAQGCTVFSCIPKEQKKAKFQPKEPTGPGPEEKKGISKLALIITAIIIAAVTAFMVFVLAVREGWIDLNDYPLLRDWIRKLGLGPLFEREVEVSRFTPRPPSAFGGAPAKPPPYKPPAPPSGSQPQQPVVRRELTPGEKARLEQYMKEHPEYAAWVKKRYGLK